MATITIPKELSKENTLFAVPQHTYEEFLAWLKKEKSLKRFKPSISEKRALARGRINLSRGNYTSLAELQHELERSNR